MPSHSVKNESVVDLVLSEKGEQKTVSFVFLDIVNMINIRRPNVLQMFVKTLEDTDSTPSQVLGPDVIPSAKNVPFSGKVSGSQNMKLF